MFRAVLPIALLGFALAGPVACEEEGPAERAGERIDEAAEKTKEAVKEAADR